MAEKYIVSYKENGYGLYLVRTKSDKISIGTCGIIKRPILPHPDIGLAFLPAFTGLGYAFEAAQATIVYAKKELDIHYIMAMTLPSNLRSIHLLGKLGLRQLDNELIKEENKCLLFGREVI